MTITQKLVGELLSAVIHSKRINSVPYDVDWHEIFQLADDHQIHSLLYTVAKEIPYERGGPDPDLLKEWKEISFVSAVNEANNYNDTCKVLSALHKADLPFIVLKGIILRELYPKPELRTMCDLDVLIKEDQIGKAREVLYRLGYQEYECTYKHIGFSHEKLLTVELHTRLLDERFAEKTKEWESGIWNNTINLNICDIPVRTLAIEDHLLFLCLHMFSHYMISGYGIRQLYDLAAFVNNMWDRIEWNAFLIKVKELYISNFIILVFNICRKLFKVEIPQELALHCPDEDTIGLVTNDIFAGGVFGNTKTEHIISGVLNKYIGKKKKLPRKATRILYLIFPPFRVMKQKYKYVGKYPVLLPFAWLQRLLINLFGTKRLFRRNKDYLALLKTHRVYEERFRIMQKLRLLEK